MKTFTVTSSESYDRHVYELVLKDGRSFSFADYEEMRATWFQHYQLGLLSHVLVHDLNKGFKNA